MADIQWSDVVGSMTVADGGYVGDLLTLARAHIDDAVTNNELTQADAGQVFTEMIPSAFQNGIGFAMQEELTEAKIDDLEAAIALKQAELDLKEGQLAMERNKVEAELEQHWGYDVTRDADGRLVLGAKTDDGKVDGEKDLITSKTAMEDDKLLTAAQNRDVLAAQEGLYVRQSAGFDDNKHQKVLETALSAWGITYQDIDVPSAPSDIITDAGIDALFTRAKQVN